MSPIARMLVASAAIAAALTGAASAQDFHLNPTYGTANLSTGFTPDPYVVNVQSGGSINASGLGSPCAGFVANAPDVRLIYTAGSRYPLIISANASADTTLVVNAPDGRWYCDDDTNGLNPLVRFNSPASGQYDIWIGTYGNSSLQPAQLSISEVP